MEDGIAFLKKHHEKNGKTVAELEDLCMSGIITRSQFDQLTAAHKRTYEEVKSSKIAEMLGKPSEAPKPRFSLTGSEKPKTTKVPNFFTFAGGATPEKEEESYLGELLDDEPPLKQDPDEDLYFITGGAGFIGSHVAEVLLARGNKVIIVDELNNYYNRGLKQNNIDLLMNQYPRTQLKFFCGDICDAKFLNTIFEKDTPTYICHLAARAGVRPSIEDPYIYVHSNVEGTTRLLDMARIHGCKHFVYASSSSVYGGSKNDFFSEDEIVDNPVSPYAATKKACELLAYTFNHLYGLNTTGLRFFTVYGPRGRPDMAPYKFIERCHHGRTIQQYGDGTTSRDYTYISDIVDGVVRALDRPLGYQVFNLGNGRPFSLKTFLDLVQKCVGKEAVIDILPEQPGDVPRTCADVSKAKELLGYEPKVSFEDGIAMTVEWYLKADAEGLFNVEDKPYLPSSNSDMELSSWTEPASAPVASRSTRFLSNFFKVFSSEKLSTAGH